jgi:hypothetical protein
VRVLDVPSRHDLVAYLQSVGRKRNSQASSNAAAPGGEF